MIAIVNWIDLGLIDYMEAYAIQENIHAGRRLDEYQDTLLFQENYPVITLGKNSLEEDLLISRDTLNNYGIEVINVDRGGGITYHGPGQIVISPILNLRKHKFGVHHYIRQLEQIVINILANYGVGGQKIEGASGVWVSDNKIASIGIAVKHGITMHGVAINVKPDLSHFKYIVPCGIIDKGSTSLKELGLEDITMLQIKKDFMHEFMQSFTVQMKEIKTIEV